MISQTLKTNRLYSALCVIFALFFSNCTTAQNNKNMSDKQNKYYSTTDTSKVTINNEEWKKNLDPEFIILHEIKAQNGHSLGNIGIIMMQAFIDAKLVAMPFLNRMVSLKAVVAGPLFLNQSHPQV